MKGSTVVPSYSCHCLAMLACVQLDLPCSWIWTDLFTALKIDQIADCSIFLLLVEVACKIHEQFTETNKSFDIRNKVKFSLTHRWWFVCCFHKVIWTVKFANNKSEIIGCKFLGQFPHAHFPFLYSYSSVFSLVIKPVLSPLLSLVFICMCSCVWILRIIASKKILVL
jgi:hypothetical protein